MRRFNKKYFFMALLLVGMVGTVSCIPTRTYDISQVDWGSLAIIIAASMLLPISSIIAFSILIYYLARQSHVRKMAMIRKGIYQPNPKDWPLILLFVGIVLIFISPAAALMTISEEGLLEGIAAGLFCFLGGAAVLAFRHLAREYLPTVLKPTEPGKPIEHTEDTENPE
jgi:hypothetical protein